jgi:hypothetical protein
LACETIFSNGRAHVRTSGPNRAFIVAVICDVTGRLTQVGARNHLRLLIRQKTASSWLAIVSCTILDALSSVMLRSSTEEFHKYDYLTLNKLLKW